MALLELPKENLIGSILLQARMKNMTWLPTWQHFFFVFVFFG
jgi:hypothetical protein